MAFTDTLPPPTISVGMFPSTTVGGWFSCTVTSVEKAVSPTVSVTVSVRVTVWSAVAAAGPVHLVLAAEALAKAPPPLLVQAKVRGSFSGSATLLVSCTSLPPSTVSGCADTDPAGASLARTVSDSVCVVERVPAPSSVTVRVSVTGWSCLAASGAVQVVSSAPASSKLPPALLVQA